MMSNNHVLAGENRGKKGRDRILQPGGLTFTSEQCIAKLIDFVDLLPSPTPHIRQWVTSSTMRWMPRLLN